jgi:polysaccharide export outer membrane protein
VTVNLVSYRSQKIIVLGEVNDPGVYPYDHHITVLEAVGLAGGITVRGKKQSVVVLRGMDLRHPEVIIANLGEALQGEAAENIALSGGDVVYVPTSLVAKVDDVFEHIDTIVSPIVKLEWGIREGLDLGD